MMAHMGIAILVNTVFIQLTGKSVFTEDTKKTSSVRTEKGESMRLIDADAYKKYLDENWIVANYDAIDAQPTIDAVEVKHGRWILGGEEGWPKWTCIVCEGDGRGDYKLCPWCGARMEAHDAN